MALLLLLFLTLQITFIAAQTSISDYAPTHNVPCPPQPLRTFSPQTPVLNSNEAAYIAARESNVIFTAWSDWLGDGSSIGYALSQFTTSLPRVAIAVGGQGYRTTQFGAAVFSALDARNSTAKSYGTGGLLQVASYLAGSSGGSWLTASLALNDWPNPTTLVYGDGHSLSGWLLDLDLVAPSGVDLGDRDNQAYWGSILASVVAKANASFDTSITDLWGRALSYHFLNQTTGDNFYTNSTRHGAGQLWSQIPLLPSYASQSMPFPIIVADSLPSGSNTPSVVSMDSVVYEFTPLEFGSWDSNLSAMAPTAYAGTHLVLGVPSDPSACVTGFDQVAFLMGSSASIFNVVADGPNGSFTGFNNQNGDDTGMQFLYEQLSSRVNSRSFNVANWPNAFQGVNPDVFQDSSSEWLSLVDGGSNLEQIPFGSLLTKARAVDVIVALDASADDSNHWPNGTALLTTSHRFSSLFPSSHQGFPPIPSSAQDFLSTGVNQRPTFFGCDPQTQYPLQYPLVIYIPNSPPLDGSPPASNTGDLQLSYSPLSTAVFINQAFNNTISGFSPNSSFDKNWGKCLQCAAIDRARFKLTPPPPRSDLCSQCFLQYCYDPKSPPSASTLPERNHVYTDPDPSGLHKVAEFLSRDKGDIIGGAVAVAVLIGAGIAFIFWWRRRKEQKSRYSRVDELRDDDEPWKYYESYAGHEMDHLSILS